MTLQGKRQTTIQVNYPLQSLRLKFPTGLLYLPEVIHVAKMFSENSSK